MKEEQNIINIKHELSVLAPSLVYMVFVILLIVIAKPQGYYQVISLVLCIVIVKSSDIILEFKRFVKRVIGATIIVSALYFAFMYSLGYGLLGFAVYIIGLSLWRMFGSSRKAKNFMAGVRRIETAFFGKSLDKDNWKDTSPTINIKVRNK